MTQSTVTIAAPLPRDLQPKVDFNPGCGQPFKAAPALVLLVSAEGGRT